MVGLDRARVLLAPSVTLWTLPSARLNVIVLPGVAAMIEPALCVIVSPVVGRSAATMVRRETAPLDPLGVARNSLAVWPVVAVTASVPDVVIGEPLTVSHEGTVMATLETPPPPAAVAFRTDPEKLRLVPRVMADGAADDPVGLPMSEDAGKFACLASVTAPGEIVMTPVDVTSVASPDMVNPPNDPALSYWIWPDEPPGVPPPPDDTRVVPEKLRPAPSVMASGTADEPVGFPSRELAAMGDVAPGDAQAIPGWLPSGRTDPEDAVRTYPSVPGGSTPHSKPGVGASTEPSGTGPAWAASIFPTGIAPCWTFLRSNSIAPLR